MQAVLLKGLKMTRSVYIFIVFILSYALNVSGQSTSIEIPVMPDYTGWPNISKGVLDATLKGKSVGLLYEYYEHESGKGRNSKIETVVVIYDESNLRWLSIYSNETIDKSRVYIFENQNKLWVCIKELLSVDDKEIIFFLKLNYDLVISL